MNQGVTFHKRKGYNFQTYFIYCDFGVKLTRLAIVTDSTAYIPEDALKDLPIFIIPLHVIWGDETYRDNVDIFQSVFYDRLNNSKILPSTSQPSPKEFIDLYKKIGSEYDQILSIHISSKLSGTVDSAIQAKNALKGMQIEVVDSQSTSMGLGFLVLTAARAAKNGESLQNCITFAESAKSRLHVYFILRTLEFLKRGGRIGGASALLGTALNLKPILMLQDGKIESFAKVRTMQKALTRLAEVFNEKIQGKTPVHAAIIQAEAEDDVIFLKNEITRIVNPNDIQEFLFAGISPVIGTHVGPGSIGICFLTEK